MTGHTRLIKLGLDANPVFASKLINDYGCYVSPCSLNYANRVFDQVPCKDTVLWTSLISAYARSNNSYKALQLLAFMIRQPDRRILPNHFTFASVARAIASLPEHLQLGQCIHARVLKSGFIPKNVILKSALVDMYVKCGVIEYARTLFDEMPHRNLVTWNAMIFGYVQKDFQVLGLELFYLMKCREFFMPDEYTVATVLLGCASFQDLILGLQIHSYAIVSGCESDSLNSIANMYFHCGQVSSAEKVLNGTDGDVFSKLMKIRGYICNQRYKDALNYVANEDNIAEVFYSDYTIIVPLLTACAKLSFLDIGKQLHAGFIAMFSCLSYHNLPEDDAEIIGAALLDMYMKCGRAAEAQKVFDFCLPAKHTSHWNAMICGYVYNGFLEDARRLFNGMPEKGVISFTSMISAYVRNGKPQEGLHLLSQMYSNEDGFRVDGNCITFVVALESCSYLTDLERGKQIHAKLIRTLDNAAVSNVFLGTALVDMYSKSGLLNCAQTVFDFMLDKNVVAWTSIILAYAVNGFGLQALENFQQMIGMGIEPNEVTFIAILTACSHCCLVDEGLQYFKMMMEKYKLVPREDHLTCLIDMLGRVGKLEEAWSLFAEIEDREVGAGLTNGTVLAAMLGACHLHGAVEIGKRVAKKMLENKQSVSSTTYVALSNVYAAAEMWNEAYGVRERFLKEGNLNGEPGLSRLRSNFVDLDFG